MEQNLKTNKNLWQLVLYFVAFYIVWIIRVVFIGPYFIEKFSDSSFTHALLNEGIRVVAWIVPAILFLKYIDGVKPMDFLKLNEKVIRNITLGVLIGIIFTIWVVFRDYFLFHMQLNLNISISAWATVLVVGLAEEITFRGFLLQKINERIGFWKGNIISAFLFMLAHYPRYIYCADKNIVLNSINIFLMGLIFGYILNRTKSLWPSVISHSLYDLATFIV